MATLNREETNMLYNAMAIIDNIRRRGFDPAKAEAGDPSEVQKRDALVKTHAEIKIVWTMKGHYNS